MNSIPFLILSIWSLFTVSVKPVQRNTEGIAVYTYQNYGPQKSETYLRFNDKGAWYSRHHKEEKITNPEGMRFYYYREDFDWYYTKDSIYFFGNKEGYGYVLPYFSQSALQGISWEITDEIQTIAGYTARKAVGKAFYEESSESTIQKSYGNVVAWFTTDIPLPYGPDGYCGLPGLIVKVEYTGFERSYKTQLKSIEFKQTENWQLPSKKGKAEVTMDQAYNPWKLGRKWFEKKKKELGL
jgi:GLPGLI family protein